MTKEQRDSLIGNVVVRYDDLIQDAGLLKENLRDFGKLVEELGRFMQTKAQNIKVCDDGGFGFPTVHDRFVDQGTINIENIQNMIPKLSSLLDEKSKIEKSLREIGRDGLIRK